MSCKHFNGVQHDVCKVGVAYRDVRDESVRPFGFPCLETSTGAATCEKVELQTQAEMAAEDAEFDKRLIEIDVVRAAIIVAT